MNNIEVGRLLRKMINDLKSKHDDQVEVVHELSSLTDDL